MTFFKVVLACLLAIGIFNFVDTAITYYVQIGPVYACSDVENNPADVRAHCKKLTRGQWWAK